MPLVKGKAASSPEGFKKNLKTELAAGKEKPQALAIAYNVARKGKKKTAKLK